MIGFEQKHLFCIFLQCHNPQCPDIRYTIDDLKSTPEIALRSKVGKNILIYHGSIAQSSNDCDYRTFEQPRLRCIHREHHTFDDQYIQRRLDRRPRDLVFRDRGRSSGRPRGVEQLHGIVFSCRTCKTLPNLVTRVAIARRWRRSHLAIGLAKL